MRKPSVGDYSGLSREQLVDAHKMAKARRDTLNREIALLETLINLKPRPMTLAEIEAHLGYKVKIQ